MGTKTAENIQGDKVWEDMKLTKPFRHDCDLNKITT